MTSITITFYSFPKVPAKWSKVLHSTLCYAFLPSRFALFVWLLLPGIFPAAGSTVKSICIFSTKLTLSSLPLNWIPFSTTYHDLTRRIWLVCLLGHNVFLCLGIKLINHHHYYHYHHNHHHSDNNISYYFLVVSYAPATFACFLPCKVVGPVLPHLSAMGSERLKAQLCLAVKSCCLLYYRKPHCISCVLSKKCTRSILYLCPGWWDLIWNSVFVNIRKSLWGHSERRWELT